MRMNFEKFVVVLVSMLLGLSISSAVSKEIKPYWDIQDSDLEMHLKSLVYMRDIIRIEESEKAKNRFNFLFLSIPDYIQDNVLNSKK